MSEIPNCPECGEEFDNIFEATDHLLEDDEKKFDPPLILPNGYKLMIGSLLRHIYKYSHDPEQIESSVQDTYAALYAAEYDPGRMKNYIENLIITEQMHNIDDEISQLLNEKPNDIESGE